MAPEGVRRTWTGAACWYQSLKRAGPPGPTLGSPDDISVLVDLVVSADVSLCHTSSGGNALEAKN